MKMFILLFIISFKSFANDTDAAIESTKQAILAYPQVQLLQKNITNKLEKQIPFSKEYAVYVTSITLTLMKSKIDTKFIRSNYNIIGGTVRPDISYDLKTEEIKGIVNINWSFK